VAAIRKIPEPFRDIHHITLSSFAAASRPLLDADDALDIVGVGVC
jgi:hypothetical protein